MWIVLGIIATAAAQRRWMAEARRMAETDDLHRAARAEAYARALESASTRYVDAVSAWHQTIPPAFSGDPDAKHAVATARRRIDAVRERSPFHEDGHHG